VASVQVPPTAPKKDRNVIAPDEMICTGCGTCAGICPRNAILMAVKKAVYVPTLIEEKCNNCGLCAASCPQANVEQMQVDAALDTEDQRAILGTFSKTYLANAQDGAIRHAAASGGVVTALLIHALEKGIIDGALVTKMNKDRPLEPEPFIARTREEIIEAARSKYCPVPANVALREILDAPDGERFAVVGSPCHLRGIRKAEETIKKLSDKIVLRLGLFCSHNTTFAYTHYILKSLNLKEEEVAEIFYRGFGWPGKTKVVLKNGTEKVFDHAKTDWGFLFNSCFFTPESCMFCGDVTAEMADISLGDPWVPEIQARERQGLNVLIARTAQAETLLEHSDLNKSVKLSPFTQGDVVRSQSLFLHFKKINLAYRVGLASLFGRKPSEPIGTSRRASGLNKLVARLSLFNHKNGPKFISVRRRVAPIVTIWVGMFYMLLWLVIKRDSRLLYRSETRPNEALTMTQSNSGYNLVVLNGFWYNRGDEAAIRAMIDSFRSKIPIKSVKIMLQTADTDHFPFPRAEPLPWIPFPGALMASWVRVSSKGKARSIASYVSEYITLLTLGRVARTKRAKQYVRAIEDADIVVDAPHGPVIGDLYGAVFELPCLLLLYIPARRGKQLFIYAPSMGPFSGRMRNWIRRRVISKARHVTVREGISAKYLHEQLGIDAEVTADSAFQNIVPSDYVEKCVKNSNAFDILQLAARVKVIGMALLDIRWMTPRYRKKRAPLQAGIERSMTALINRLIAEGYTIVLLPQQFGKFKLADKERELYERFRSLNVEKIYVLDEGCDTYCQQVIISKLFAVVTMRYHTTIFAAKASVPALIVAYEHKTHGLAEQLGRLDLTLDVEDVDAQALIERFTYLENNYDVIKQELAITGQRLMRESQKTTERIVESLHGD
jgi:coenzyme F420 hydrogenase subunit beta